MDWGNAIIRNITRTATGEVSHIDVELHLAGDFKSTEKKITWLAKATPSHQLVKTTLLDYDYLVTKRKLEKDDTVQAVATPQTEFIAEALADANILSLSPGDIIQFERKGYFRLDKIEKDGEDGKRLVFIRIPDGRAAGIALKSGGANTIAPDVKKTDALHDESIKMYKVDPVANVGQVKADTKMYEVNSVYED